MGILHLGLLYILVGGTGCIAVILLSDWKVSHGGVRIQDTCEIRARRVFHHDDLVAMFAYAKERNASLFVLSAAAVSKGELVDAASVRLGVASENQEALWDEILYSVQSMPRTGTMRFDGTRLIAYESDARELAARVMYDFWASRGGVALARQPGRFLKANRVAIFPRYGSLRLFDKLFVPSRGDKEALGRFLGSFSAEAASLLISIVNGVGVIS